MAVAERTLDVRAIAFGAVVAMGVAVPAALIGKVVSDSMGDEEPSNIVFLFFAIVLAGFVAGGFAAATRASHAPFSNGALAALTAYALVQGIALAFILLDGETVKWGQIVFNGLVANGSGMLGGLLASRRTAER